MMRLFMAIPLDPAIKAALAGVQNDLRPFGKALRLVTEEQMHLTVKFLSDVPDSDAPELCDAVDRIAAGCRPFDFVVRGLGCFPTRGAPRVVWAGVEDPSGQLAECHQTSDAIWKELSFAPENRPFSPHLTLGRVKNPAAGREIRAALTGRSFEAGRQHVDQLALYESVLSPSGATHRVVHRADLDTSSAKNQQKPASHRISVPDTGVPTPSSRPGTGSTPDGDTIHGDQS